MIIRPSPPSCYPSSSPLDHLRSLRGDLVRSVAVIDCQLTSTALEIGDPEPDADTLIARILEPVLDRLEMRDDIRILRHLVPDIVEVSGTERASDTSVVVIVDVETTGLDHDRDEVIEIGMLRVEHIDGMVTRVTSELSALRQSNVPITAEITRLTGITAEMVVGYRIDPGEVSDLLLGADLVVAHHAAFDRPFCEAIHPGFADMPWACSVRDVDWGAAGFDGAKLGHLLLQSGWFHHGHRALDDCHALLHLLRVRQSTTQGGEDAPLLRGLVASAAETRRRIWAEGAPFERKDLLKARGYRWSLGGRTAPRAWWRDVREEDLSVEMRFLHTEVYGRYRFLRTDRLTARDRYRAG